MGRKSNGDGSVRQLSDGSWECVIQSKYPNPKTGNPKRIKRKATTEKEAIEKAKMALTAWEKGFEEGKDIKVNKTKTFGMYMEEFIESNVKPNLTGSGYHSYISAMKNNFYPFAISKMQLSMLNKVEFQKYFDEILSLKSRKTCSFPVQLCRRCCKWLQVNYQTYHLIELHSAHSTNSDKHLLPNVLNYEDFMRRMQKDNKFEGMIQDMTIGIVAGKSSLAKNKYRW